MSGPGGREGVVAADLGLPVHLVMHSAALVHAQAVGGVMPSCEQAVQAAVQATGRSVC